MTDTLTPDPPGREWPTVLVFHCEDCDSPRWRVKVDADTGAIAMLQCRKCGAIYTAPAKPRLALRVPKLPVAEGTPESS